VANSVARSSGAYTLSVQSSRGGGRPSDDDGGGAQQGGRGTLADLGRMQLPRITRGQTVSGRLGPGDFLRTDDNTYADGYFYDGRAGEQITVTMRSSSFDSWVVVDDPNGPLREHDDDGAGGNDARLTVTLPHAGRYLIVANAVGRDANGSYTLTVEGSGGGGAGPANDAGGSGGTIADLGRMRLPRITAGQTVSGRLTSSDFVRSDDNSYADGYEYIGRAGEQITISLSSGAFDSWVVIDDPEGPLQEHDDDSGGGNDAQLTVTLPHAGRYVIIANSVGARATGAYTLTVRSGGGGRKY
jgi:hypothetical protein